METYFASPIRASEEKLSLEIDIVSNNPVISGLLQSVGGLIAVLNSNRQVVALNDSFMKDLGVVDPYESLGLRPGEILQCIHARKKPAGCGTTKYCATCGAAIAIVAGIEQEKPVERVCTTTVKRANKNIDIVLLVRSNGILIENEKFILLFLQDITQEHSMAALERTFFHDVNNILLALTSACELLHEENPSDLTQIVNRSAMRLKDGIAIQQNLIKSEAYVYKPFWCEVRIEQVFEELESFFSTHPVTLNKKLEILKKANDTNFKTDTSLLQRILCNMVINAFEASSDGQTIKIWHQVENELITFCVWNNQYIPESIALRMFQKNFSTKEESGRGIGTFSMKYFGETILGGTIDFTTSKEKGTIFTLSLPL